MGRAGATPRMTRAWRRVRRSRDDGGGCKALTTTAFSEILHVSVLCSTVWCLSRAPVRVRCDCLCDCPLIGFTKLFRERREPTRRVAFVRNASIGTHANRHDLFRRRRTVDEDNLIYTRTHG